MRVNYSRSFLWKQSKKLRHKWNHLSLTRSTLLCGSVRRVQSTEKVGCSTNECVTRPQWGVSSLRRRPGHRGRGLGHWWWPWCQYRWAGHAWWGRRVQQTRSDTHLKIHCNVSDRHTYKVESNINLLLWCLVNLIHSVILAQTGDSEESDLGAAAAESSDAAAGHSRAAEESRENRLWRSVVIGEQEHRIDMKCIEPYKRVISHGGTLYKCLKSVPARMFHSTPPWCFPFSCISLFEMNQWNHSQSIPVQCKNERFTVLSQNVLVWKLKTHMQRQFESSALQFQMFLWKLFHTR